MAFERRPVLNINEIIAIASHGLFSIVYICINHRPPNPGGG